MDINSGKPKNRKSPPRISGSETLPTTLPTVDEAEAEGGHGAAESLTLAVSDNVDDVEMVQAVEEQQPQQLQQQSKSPSDDEHKEGERANDAIANIKNWITYYKESIAKLEKSCDEINASVRQIASRIDVAGRAFCHLDNLHAFFRQDDNYFLGEALDPDASIKAKRTALRKFIAEEKKNLKEEKKRLAKNEESLEEERKSLKEEKRRLEEKEKGLEEEKIRLDQEKNRLIARSELTSSPKSTGITWSKAKKGEGHSGLLHVEDTMRISLVQDESIDIGIIEPAADRRPPFKLRDDIGTWEPCPELIAAWPIVDKNSTDSDFFALLYHHTDKLNEKRLRNACRALNFEFDLTKNTAGEMLMQQQLLTPFTMLVNAAASGDCVETEDYKADEDVSASRTVSCKDKETDDPVLKRISIKPDSAVTLRPKLDVFGMIEMKRAEQMDGDGWFHDIDKCAMMTATTATIVSDYMPDKTLQHQVAIPFIHAAGRSCSLYVTTLDEQGIPRIQVVKYPGMKEEPQESAFNNLQESPSRARVRFFVTFAILLNKFKTLFDRHIKAKYDAKFESIWGKVHGVPTYSLMNLKKPKGSQNKDQKTDSGKRTHQQRGTSAEKSAMEAAECGGRFSHVKYPFIRNTQYTDHGMVDFEQTNSPFYFRARATEVCEGMNSNDVFLKVWKDGDVDLEYLLLEWENHRRAFKAGVPVAAPVFDELERSTSSCGSAYLVFAVEFIHEDRIQDEKDSLHFCTSLIETVVKLHEEAGLLHGDIKPANLCWSDQIVKLIDFGHSQSITSATWSRGTEGFEAPEIVESTMPCSTKTDAYSVGATILSVLKELDKSIQQNHLCLALRDIAMRLKDFDPGTRWLLPQALRQIHSINEKNGSPPVQVKKFKINQNSSLMSPWCPVEAE